MCTREISSLPWQWEGEKACTYRSMRRKKSLQVHWAHVVLVQRRILLCLQCSHTHMHGASAGVRCGVSFMHTLWVTHHPAIIMFESTSICHSSLTKGHWNRFSLNDSSLRTRQSVSEPRVPHYGSTHRQNANRSWGAMGFFTVTMHIHPLCVLSLEQNHTAG